jgi:hypothetical protein
VPLAERWNGTSWTIQPTPRPSGAKFALLASVSCPARNFCVAVGHSAKRAGAGSVLAERWNGRTWTLERLPAPAGASDSFLTGASCSSSTRCLAVGYTLSSREAAPLAERWTGRGWTLQSTPRALDSEFHGVSCTASGVCIAVGISAAPLADDDVAPTLEPRETRR